MEARHIYKINEQSEKFTFHNSKGSSNIDLTITNKLIADMHDGKSVNKRIVRTKFH